MPPKERVAKREFLILEVGETHVPGSSFILRGVAESEARARDEIQKMAIAGGVRLAIVETKGVFVREPVVTIKPVGELIVTANK
jgi:hypothetical protein